MLLKVDYFTTLMQFLVAIKSTLSRILISKRDTQKTRSLKMTNLQNFKKQLNSVAPIECGLKVGDRVIYKNDFGIKFGPFEVIGFEKKEDISGGRFVYLNSDSYWFPVKAEQLAKQ